MGEDSNVKWILLDSLAENSSQLREHLVQYGKALPPDETLGSGWTLIHVAAMNGYTECVKTLLEFGTQTWDQPNICGRTPAYLAAGWNRMPVLKILVALGATIPNPQPQILGSVIQRMRNLSISTAERLAIRNQIYFQSTLLERLLVAIPEASE